MAIQQFRGNLAGLPLTDTVGDVRIQATPGRDVVIQLSDDLGAKRILIKDFSGNIVSTINSDGQGTAAGTTTYAAALAFTAGAAPANDGEIGRIGGVLGFFDVAGFHPFRFVSLVNGASPLGASALNLVAGSGISLVRTESPAGQMNVTVQSEAAALISFRQVDPTADAVTGQANTYYIDKGATTYGYNVDVDAQGTPLLWVYINGRERFLAPESDFGHPTRLAECAAVRSLSTGVEGPAASGSRNAVKLASPLSGGMWLHYRRKSQATF